MQQQSQTVFDEADEAHSLAADHVETIKQRLAKGKASADELDDAQIELTEKAQTLQAAQARNDKASAATEACLLQRAKISGHLAQVRLISHPAVQWVRARPAITGHNLFIAGKARSGRRDPRDCTYRSQCSSREAAERSPGDQPRPCRRDSGAIHPSIAKARYGHRRYSYSVQLEGYRNRRGYVGRCALGTGGAL